MMPNFWFPAAWMDWAVIFIFFHHTTDLSKSQKGSCATILDFGKASLHNEMRHSDMSQTFTFEN
jgi:hypothetical protein